MYSRIQLLCAETQSGNMCKCKCSIYTGASDRLSLFHDALICLNSTNISRHTWRSPGWNRCAWTSWPCCWTICQTWQLSWHRPRACARLSMLWKHFGRSSLAWQAWCTPVHRNHFKKGTHENIIILIEIETEWTLARCTLCVSYLWNKHAAKSHCGT